MFSTHLKFFIRIFLKDKFFSILNILGLGLGIAVSILLILILQHDLTYDKHYPNHERIFRLGGHTKATGVDFLLAQSARELAPILKAELPEVNAVTNVDKWYHTLVKYEDNGNSLVHYEENIVHTDSSYFKVFQHKFIEGNPDFALKEPNAVVITERIAKKYFGSDDPIAKTLLINGATKEVKGVIADLPGNSHLKFDFLVSGLEPERGWPAENSQQISETFWNPDVYSYILFQEDYNYQRFYDKFPMLYDKYFKTFGDHVNGEYTPILQPLADIHFDSSLDADLPSGNSAYLYAFASIGIFIILLACINYMNLSTAKSVNRASEIAIKKTLGSEKKSLIFSFLGESIFLAFISLIVAVMLIYIVIYLTPFNNLIQKELHVSFWNNGPLLFGTISMTLAIGVFSGLYPAFYLPSIPTIGALKGAYKNKKSSRQLRQGLITFQFAISIFVVACTFFMQDQMNFMRSKDLGFDSENILILPIQDTVIHKKVEVLKNDFLNNSKISNVTTSYQVFGTGSGGPVMFAESEEGMVQQQFNMVSIGDDYLNTMGIELLVGRDFQNGMESDLHNAFICNQAAAKLMGWGDDPVGKRIRFFHNPEDGQVVGMVKDFNYASLHNSVEPLLLVKNGEGGYFHLKVSGEDFPKTLSYIQKKWESLNSSSPFEFYFQDQRLNEQYQEDEIQYKLLSGLAYICIFICLLGLMGLSAFSASQRTKEIGIRKVHGASIPRIVYLLYKEVMVMVLVAGILIIPVSLYFVSQWLGNFAYQVQLNYFTFAFILFFALLVALVTVGFHTIKAATANPIHSLKYE